MFVTTTPTVVLLSTAIPPSIVVLPNATSTGAVVATITATASPQSTVAASPPTETLVQEISSVARVPVAGLPPTGTGPRNDGSLIWILWWVRVTGLGGGSTLLLWSALVWARRRAPREVRSVTPQRLRRLIAADNAPAYTTRAFAP